MGKYYLNSLNVYSTWSCQANAELRLLSCKPSVAPHARSKFLMSSTLFDLQSLDFVFCNLISVFCSLILVFCYLM